MAYVRQITVSPERQARRDRVSDMQAAAGWQRGVKVDDRLREQSADFYDTHFKTRVSTYRYSGRVRVIG